MNKELSEFNAAREVHTDLYPSNGAMLKDMSADSANRIISAAKFAARALGLDPDGKFGQLLSTNIIDLEMEQSGFTEVPEEKVYSNEGDGER